MIITELKRVIRAGFIDFWRNGFVSLASILVFVVTLFIIGTVMLSSLVLNTAISELKDKVDINVYLTLSASEADGREMSETIRALPEVKEVIYVSREEVLAEFRERHKNDSTILQSLEELGSNPLPAEINIKANDPSNYESITTFLEERSTLSPDSSGLGIISRINYFENKRAIDTLTRFIDVVDNMGIVTSIVFVFLAVLVSFNTIRLAIFTSREEIGVMRLVGASNSYIRGPFIVEGIMYGFLAAIITIVIFYPITKWISNATESFYGGLNLFSFYSSNLIRMALILIVIGIILGSISSFLAVKRYLKV